MFVRYSLLLLFALYANSLWAQHFYRVERIATMRSEYGYLLHTKKTTNQQTTLRFYYPHGNPWINPKYTISYDDQGNGSFHEASGKATPARISYVLTNKRWHILCDTVSYVIYREKKHKQ